MPLSPSPETRRKFFTVSEANKALPLVRAIVGDIVHEYRAVVDLKGRLSALDRVRDRKRGATHKPERDPYAEELAQSEAEVESGEARLRELVAELEALGVELKGPDGLCDFPARFAGHEVCLCWKLGEPEVLFWHEVHAGFDGRRSIAELADEAARTT